MDTIKEISIIITWYGSQSRDYNDIDNLIYTRKKLATLSFALAGEVGDAKNDLDVAIFKRKLAFSKEFDRLTSEAKVSGVSAKEKANITIEVLCENEAVVSGIYHRTKMFLSQTNEVLSTLNQHISYLKAEKKQTPQTQV